MALLQSKSLTEKHAALVAELGRLKVDFQGLSARLGSAAGAQRAIDRIGASIVDLERQHGITEARELSAHETVTDDAPMFEEMVKKYSASVDWPAELAAGRIAKDEVEEKIAARAQIVAEARRTLETLKRVRADVEKRRKKFSAEILALAAEPDPLSRDERLSFTELSRAARLERVTYEHLSEILAPVPV